MRPSWHVRHGKQSWKLVCTQNWSYTGLVISSFALVEAAGRLLRPATSPAELVGQAMRPLQPVRDAQLPPRVVARR